MKRKVPLLHLRALHQPIRDEVLPQMTRVVDSQRFIMGEDVNVVEKSIAEYCAVPPAIGCASSSDALMFGLLAAGGKPGDSVAATPVARVGATPVFVEIQPELSTRRSLLACSESHLRCQMYC